MQLDITTHRIVLSFHIFNTGKLALSNIEYEELKDLKDKKMELEELFHILLKRGINLIVSHLKCKK